MATTNRRDDQRHHRHPFRYHRHSADGGLAPGTGGGGIVVPGVAPAAPQNVAFTSAHNTRTPAITASLDAPVAGDGVRVTFADGGAAVTPYTYTLLYGDITGSTAAIGFSALPRDGIWTASVEHKRANSSYSAATASSAWVIDTVGPTISAISVGTPTSSGVTSSITSSEAGTIAYGIWPSASTPTQADIIAGTGAVSGTAGSTANSAGVAITPSFSGLTASTPYKLQVVAADVYTNKTTASAQSFTTAAGGGAYTAPGVRFNGSNTNLLNASAMTGVAASKVGTLSFWLKMMGGDSTLQRVLNFGPSDAIVCERKADNTLLVTGPGAFAATSSTTLVSGGDWVHAICSWDVAAGVIKLFLNDVDRTSGPVTINTASTLAGLSVIGCDSGGSLRINAEIAELYFNPVYFDLTVTANRRKFINASGFPVDLGSTGNGPTGSAPPIWLSGNSTTFPNNGGTGGAYSIAGTLANSSDSPSV